MTTGTPDINSSEPCDSSLVLHELHTTRRSEFWMGVPHTTQIEVFWARDNQNGPTKDGSASKRRYWIGAILRRCSGPRPLQPCDRRLEKLYGSCSQIGLRLQVLLPSLRGVLACSTDTSLGQGIYLILHERNQRRHHDGANIG